MATLLSGLVGGLVATIAMTMFMMALGVDSPPPTAALWAKFVGDKEPEAYMMPGMALHMMYGIGPGGAFALIATTAGLGVDTLTGALLWALGFAAVLTVVGMVFWMRVVLAMEPKPRGYVRAVPRRLRRRPRWESYIPPLLKHSVTPGFRPSSSPSAPTPPTRSTSERPLRR